MGHRDNPYPTKSEKVMLALLTRMTLTQVSTWFANARRRLKKEKTLRCHGDGRDGETVVVEGGCGGMDGGGRERVDISENGGDFSNDDGDDDKECDIKSVKNLGEDILNHHHHHHRLFLPHLPHLQHQFPLNSPNIYDSKSLLFDSNNNDQLLVDKNNLNTHSFLSSSSSSSSLCTKDTTNNCTERFKSGEAIWSIKDIIGT